MAPSHGATSVVLSSAVFTRFIDQRTLLVLHNNQKMILMIIQVYGAEICVSMARSRGVPSFHPSFLRQQEKIDTNLLGRCCEEVFRPCLS